MTRELLTSWGDYQNALATLLPLAKNSLVIYDHDLGRLQLETLKHHEQLTRLLSAQHHTKLQISVRHTGLLRTQHPRLLKLASTFGHRLFLKESPASLANLRDCLIVADAKHALIRFDWEQARAKLLLNEPEEVRQYQQRFNDIWAEGGEEIGASTLGL